MSASLPTVVTLPGVYRPRSDSALLHDALAAAGRVGGRWLDVCTGTGVLALTAHRLGARDVTAIDICPHAARNARLNAALHRAPLRVLQGDLFGPVRGERFDVIVSNPPYVPADPAAGGPAPAGAQAWDAGADGRLILDRLCDEAPGLLTPDGVLLIVQSSFAAPQLTARMLESRGLRVEEAGRHTGALGPIAAARRDYLGVDEETLVVLRATDPGITISTALAAASVCGDRPRVAAAHASSHLAR